MDYVDMPALRSPQTTLKYRHFVIDLAAREVFIDDEPVDIGPKVVEAFAVLVRAEGRFVPKEVFADLWPDSIDSDKNVWQAISTLRKILAPACGNVITTLPRRGYRLEPTPPATLGARRGPESTALRRLVALVAACGAVVLLLPSFVPATSAQDAALASFRGSDRELYEVARHELDYRTLGTLTHALENFRSLVARHPNNGLALAGLSEALLLRNDYMNVGPNANPNRDAAQRVAERSVVACPSCSETHAALGLVRTYRDPLDVSGVSELRKAVALNRDSASVHLFLGEALAGRDERGALTEFVRAEELDPASPPINAWMGAAYYSTGRSDRAAYYLRRALELDPTRSDSAVTLAYTYEQKGEFAQALRIYRGLRDPYIDPVWRDVLIARIQAISGDRSEALAYMRHAPHTSRDSIDVAVETAGLYSVLGNRRAAIDLLVRVFSHDGHINYFTHDPRLATLWSDPALKPLLDETGPNHSRFN
jgi:DNA-binding winged helix-turn-helix (wHTH) protein/Flp pilus assembly protein TadD